MMPKAWVNVPPTQSVPGTEDDEIFYLPQFERKQKAREYYQKNADRLRPMHNEYSKQYFKKKQVRRGHL